VGANHWSESLWCHIRIIAHWVHHLLWSTYYLFWHLGTCDLLFGRTFWENFLDSLSLLLVRTVLNIMNLWSYVRSLVRNHHTLDHLRLVWVIWIEPRLDHLPLCGRYRWVQSALTKLLCYSWFCVGIGNINVESSDVRSVNRHWVRSSLTVVV